MRNTVSKRWKFLLKMLEKGWNFFVSSSVVSRQDRKVLFKIIYTLAAKKRKTAEKPSSSILATGEKSKKKQSKLLVERDEEGKIIYPLVINPSLSILNIGKIEYEKPGYHTEK